MLSDHAVDHVRDIGWASLQNGALIAAADGIYDVLVTVDKNMRFQQSLKGRSLTVVVLDVPDVEILTYQRFVSTLRKSLSKLAEGQFIIVIDPDA
jgi:hypothetical protein